MIESRNEEKYLKIKLGKKSLIKFSVATVIILGLVLLSIYLTSTKTTKASIDITGPQKMEYEPEILGNLWSKKIVIYHTDCYPHQNVFVSTSIPENLVDIELFKYLDDNTMIRVTKNPEYDFKLEDMNEDERFDAVSWIIPELQEFGRVVFSVEGKVIKGE